MCTAITFKNKDLYFGRTLDNDFSYNEQVVVTPRNFKLNFKHIAPVEHHNAIIGMAYVYDNYPLYYDAANEKGLCIAGLNFVGNAKYNDFDTTKTNIAQYELLPYLLGTCGSVEDVLVKLKEINITDTKYKDNMPSAQLHWIIADSKRTITVESVADGLKIYDNKVGVLANNPDFKMQMFNLNNYINITSKQPLNRFSDDLDFDLYCRGLGALGLPGDLSSQSRFVRASFVNKNAYMPKTDLESISQFFHIIGSVEQQKGCNDLGDDKYETTLYTSCINASKGVYYYTTYNNRQISGVDMNKTDLEDNTLKCFDLCKNENINMQN